MRKLLAAITILFILGSALSAQTKATDNILTLDVAGISPSASIDEVAWIAGYWKGEALGGAIEEVWTEPIGGSMMCAFKLVVADTVKFYELVALREVNNSLTINLKHFHSDMKGWEEKDETVDFPLVKMTDGKAFFDGFTFEQVSDNEMNIYVLFGKEGNYKEMKFSYMK